MKKTAVVLAMILMVLSLFSCGNTSSSEVENSLTTESSIEPSDSREYQSVSQLARIYYRSLDEIMDNLVKKVKYDHINPHYIEKYREIYDTVYEKYFPYVEYDEKQIELYLASVTASYGTEFKVDLHSFYGLVYKEKYVRIEIYFFKDELKEYSEKGVLEYIEELNGFGSYKTKPFNFKNKEYDAIYYYEERLKDDVYFIKYSDDLYIFFRIREFTEEEIKEFFDLIEIKTITVDEYIKSKPVAESSEETELSD